jgi:hypothetical protein
MHVGSVVTAGFLLAFMVPVGSASASADPWGIITDVDGGHLAASSTFGANLSATPHQPEFTCADVAVSNGRPASTCMVSYIGTSPNTLSPPTSGTVTTVRVRSGSVGGPMRINVIRFLFQQTGNPAYPLTAGPFLETYGPQFAAAPNSVTSVPVNLQLTVTAAPDPSDQTTIQTIDALALELLDTKATVPVFDSPGVLSYPSVPGPTSLGVPAPSPNTLQTFPSINAGVFMNADFATSSPPGGTPPGGTPPGTTAPSVTLPTAPLTVRKGSVGVPVNCVGADCQGTLTLRPRVAASAGKAKLYGRKAFTVSAGSSKTVRVKLTKVGRKALGKHKRLRVTAAVLFTNGQRQAFPLTLKKGK